MSQATNIATLILVIWLSYTNTQNTGHIQNIQTKLSQQDKQQDAFQKNILEKLNAMAEFVSKQKQAEQQRKKAEEALAQKKQFVQLLKTYSDLLTVELLQQDGKLKEAAVLLKASKDSIWQAGDIYPSHKQKLQALMQPIDETLQIWQSGKAKSILNIYQVIQAVIKAVK